VTRMGQGQFEETAILELVTKPFGDLLMSRLGRARHGVS